MKKNMTGVYSDKSLKNLGFSIGSRLVACNRTPSADRIDALFSSP